MAGTMPNPTTRSRLAADRATLAAQLAELDAAIAVLARYEPARAGRTPGKGNGNGHTLAPATAKARPALTPARRAAISRRMRAYWKERRAAASKGR
jgi:hypothetical protein